MKKSKIFLPFVALALTFGLAACNQSGSQPGGKSVAPSNPAPSQVSSVPAKPKITVSAGDNKTTLDLEQTVQLSAKNGAEAVDGVTWASSDATVASVSATGLVTALKKGEVTITASKDGFTSGSIALTINGADIIVQVESGTSEGDVITFKESHNVDTDMIDQWPSNAVLTLNFNVAKAGNYEFYISCRAHGGYQSTNTDVFADVLEVKVNNAAVTLSGQAEGGTFTDYKAGEVALVAGPNVMTVKSLAADNENPTIDYFMVSPKA